MESASLELDALEWRRRNRKPAPTLEGSPSHVASAIAALGLTPKAAGRGAVARQLPPLAGDAADARQPPLAGWSSTSRGPPRRRARPAGSRARRGRGDDDDDARGRRRRRRRRRGRGLRAHRALVERAVRDAAPPLDARAIIAAALRAPAPGRGRRGRGPAGRSSTRC